MLRSLLILLLAIVTLQLNAADPKNKTVVTDTVVTKAYLEKLEARIEKLETTTSPGELTKERLGLINEKIENLQSETERTATGISNQIAESSNYLSVWGYVFGAVGIFVAAFAAWMQNRSGHFLEKSKEILKSQEAIEAEVLETKRLINNNLGELYYKLQLAEADYLITRLQKEVRDIENIFSKLTTIHLPENYFSKLNDLIATNPDIDRASKRKIQLLIMQHFPNTWLKDTVLKQDFIDGYYWYISAMFDQELEDLLTSIITYFKTVAPNELDYAVAASFILYACNLKFDPINKSVDRVDFKLPLHAEHKVKVQERVERFYNRIEDKVQRFTLLRKTMELTVNLGLSKSNLRLIFGDLLLRDYKADSNNTEEQSKLLVDLESKLNHPIQAGTQS